MTDTVNHHLAVAAACALLAGYDSLVAVVDDGGGAHECDEANNEAAIALPDYCP